MPGEPMTGVKVGTSKGRNLCSTVLRAQPFHMCLTSTTFSYLHRSVNLPSNFLGLIAERILERISNIIVVFARLYQLGHMLVIVKV